MEKNDLNIITASLKREAIKKIHMLQGYFQFKAGEHSQEDIKLLEEIKKIIDQL